MKNSISPPTRFSYERWRHGGWYVNEVLYPTGAFGCISNNYADRKWRIACDPRPFEEQPTFRTRDGAALAEWHLAQEKHAAQQALIDAWGRYGVKLEADRSMNWQWAEAPGEEDPADWTGIYSPPFSTFEACIADAEASLGPLPAHLASVATAAPPVAAPRKLKVLLQQYVEKVAVVEVTIPEEANLDDDEAIAYAIAQAEKQADSAKWEDGDDAQSVETYGVKNDASEMIWER